MGIKKIFSEEIWEKNAAQPHPYSSIIFLLDLIWGNDGIKRAIGPKTQPSSLSVLPPWCPDGIYQAIALVHHDGAPVLHAWIHWAKVMKNDPAHLQGEPFGSCAFSLYERGRQSLSSKGNPVKVKVLNFLHLAILASRRVRMWRLEVDKPLNSQS